MCVLGDKIGGTSAENDWGLSLVSSEMAPTLVDRALLLNSRSRPEVDERIEGCQQLLEGEAWRKLDIAAMERTLSASG